MNSFLFALLVVLVFTSEILFLNGGSIFSIGCLYGMFMMKVLNK